MNVLPSCRVLTGVQVRSARALLNWSVDRLSQEAGIRPGTIRRLEEINGGLTDEAEVSAIEKTQPTLFVKNFSSGPISAQNLAAPAQTRSILG
jgi:hypothetical protein